MAGPYPPDDKPQKLEIDKTSIISQGKPDMEPKCREKIRYIQVNKRIDSRKNVDYTE